MTILMKFSSLQLELDTYLDLYSQLQELHHTSKYAR